MTSKQIYDSFKIHFEKINRKPFTEIEGITLENLKPIFHYFAKDNRFFYVKIYLVYPSRVSKKDC
jgi:hypothetical protein